MKTMLKPKSSSFSLEMDGYRGGGHPIIKSVDRMLTEFRRSYDGSGIARLSPDRCNVLR